MNRSNLIKFDIKKIPNSENTLNLKYLKAHLLKKKRHFKWVKIKSQLKFNHPSRFWLFVNKPSWFNEFKICKHSCKFTGIKVNWCCYFILFGHIHTYRLVVLVVWFIFNHWCLSSSYFFGHIQKVNVCWCDLFGHVQIFWSYSFGHVESVKWLFLI